jgi:hypothetical protein
VALLALSIQSGGKINTTALCVEPEHALIMLGQLDFIAKALRDYIESQANTLASGGQVIPLRRCA